MHVRVRVALQPLRFQVLDIVTVALGDRDLLRRKESAGDTFSLERLAQDEVVLNVVGAVVLEALDAAATQSGGSGLACGLAADVALGWHYGIDSVYPVKLYCLRGESRLFVGCPDKDGVGCRVEREVSSN